MISESISLYPRSLLFISLSFRSLVIKGASVVAASLIHLMDSRTPMWCRRLLGELGYMCDSFSKRLRPIQRKNFSITSSLWSRNLDLGTVAQRLLHSKNRSGSLWYEHRYHPFERRGHSTTCLITDSLLLMVLRHHIKGHILSSSSPVPGTEERWWSTRSMKVH